MVENLKKNGVMETSKLIGMGLIGEVMAILSPVIIFKSDSEILIEIGAK